MTDHPSGEGALLRLRAVAPAGDQAELVGVPRNTYCSGAGSRRGEGTTAGSAGDGGARHGRELLDEKYYRR